MWRECFPYLVAEIDIKNNPTNELKRFYFVNDAIKCIGKKTDRGIFIKRENAGSEFRIKRVTFNDPATIIFWEFI